MRLLQYMEMFVKEDIKDRLTQEACKIANDNCGTLLYLPIFGSGLYGTVTNPDCDIDIKGVFLPFTHDPSEEVMLKGQVESSKHVAFTKNWEKTTDHTKVKYEIELWSLQLWLKKFLKNGDTGAVDTLYSYDRKDAILYESPIIKDLFLNRDKLFNPKNTRSFLGYAIGQAQRYGVKGIRLKALIKILDFFCVKYDLAGDELVDSHSYNKIIENYADKRLEEYIDPLLETCYHDLYCHLLTKDGKPKIHAGMRVLRVNGKEHQGVIFVDEFLRRITTGISEYGHRATKAMKTEGKDWKALSHAYRVILEVLELLSDGIITFPLPYAEIIKTIKKGEMPLEDVRELISIGLSQVDKVRKETKIIGSYDKEYVNKFILSCYE